MSKDKPQPYGDGGLFQRKSNWRWFAQIEAGYNAKGGRKRVTVSNKGCVGGCKLKCPHRTQIKTKLARRRADIERDGHTDTDQRTTVKVAAEEWLEVVKRKTRPKPFATDQSAVNKWIIPTIGHRRLAEVTPRDIRAVGNAQREAGRSTSTAARTHGTLMRLLKWAIIEGHGVPTRVLQIEAPGLAANDRTDMTVLEALAVLKVASELPHGSRWALAFFGGVRQAECLGLTWDAVDLELGHAIIEWQLQPLPYVDRKQKSLGFRTPDGYEVRQLVDSFHLVRPKTKKGYRVVPLVPALVEALRDWQQSSPANPHGLIWPAADGRPARDSDDREEWHALQCTAGVGHRAGRWYHLHEARHTTASQLLEIGTDEHTITAIMGHSSIVTTRGYQHISQARALEALTSMAERLKG